ncbi:MAG: hypothetical protein LJF06_15660 [Gemmatimonadetes bacterium]|nr:hypothetical protein [Gemmatimonadota bacterium]
MTPGRVRVPTRLWIPLGAGCVLFAVNNFLLTKLLTALPGGTVLAPTDLAAVALVVLWIRRFGGVLLIYGGYASLGIIGHLRVDVGSYLLHLPLVLGAALAYDVVVAMGRYRRWALAAGLVPFAMIVRWEQAVTHPRAWAGAVVIASLGLATGLVAHGALTRSPSRASAP